MSRLRVADAHFLEPRWMIKEQALAGHLATADERATAERGLAVSQEGGFEGLEGVKSFVLL